MKILKYGAIIVVTLLTAAIGFMSCGSRGGTLSSITVSPADPTIATGTKYQFTALATFSDGTKIDWTTAAIWSTSNAAVTIGNSLGSYGLATSVSTGPTGTFTITATDTANNISGTAMLTVVDPISITITPANPYMAIGTTHQFKAMANLSTGGTTTITQDLTTYASWTTSSAEVATVSDTAVLKGRLTSAATGTTDIIATIITSQSATVQGSTRLIVTAKPLESIAIMPVNPIISLATATTQKFTAQGTFQDKTTSDLTSSVTWLSSNTGVATISNEEGTYGLATAIVTNATTTATTTIRAIDPITGKYNYTTFYVTP